MTSKKLDSSEISLNEVVNQELTEIHSITIKSEDADERAKHVTNEQIDEKEDADERAKHVTNEQIDEKEDADHSSDTSSWSSGTLTTSIKRYHPLPHSDGVDEKKGSQGAISYNQTNVGIARLREQLPYNESTDIDDSGRQAADSDYEACESSDETIDGEPMSPEYLDEVNRSVRNSLFDPIIQLDNKEPCSDHLSLDTCGEVDTPDVDNVQIMSVSTVTASSLSSSTLALCGPTNTDQVLEKAGLETNKFKFLIDILKDQHRQQVELQKVQQEKQMQFLTMQMSVLLEQPVRVDVEDVDKTTKIASFSSLKESGNSDTESNDFPEEFLQPSNNELTSKAVQDDTLTSSSDGQQQRNNLERSEDLTASKLSVTSDQKQSLRDYQSLSIVQQHFLEQQRQIQREYNQHLEELQQQWIGLQDQQTQEQMLLKGAIDEQMQRLSEQQHHLDEKQSMINPVPDHNPDTPPGGRNDNDDNSTVYSNFSYWGQNDTYRPLPYTHTRTDYTAFLNESSNIWAQSAASVVSVETDSQCDKRLDLKEKHARHIADLKEYYENEIHELLQDNIGQTAESPQIVCIEANERLQQKCQQLEAALRLSSNRIEDLEATVKTLDTKLIDWPKKYGVAMDTITILEKQIESVNILCVEKDTELKYCQKTLADLKLYLKQANEVIPYSVEKDQLNKSEYESKTEVIDLRRGTPDHYSTNHSLHKTEAKKSPIQELTMNNTGDRPIQGSTKPNVPSVEERKFLTSGADFNFFTGEDIQHSSAMIQHTDADSKLESSGDESSIHPLDCSDLDVSLNRSGLFASMRSTLHPGPFDADLDHRPISPMMKAAAQFNRWMEHDDLEKSHRLTNSTPTELNVHTVQRHHGGTVNHNIPAVNRQRVDQIIPEQRLDSALEQDISDYLHPTEIATQAPPRKSSGSTSSKERLRLMQEWNKSHSKNSNQFQLERKPKMSIISSPKVVSKNSLSPGSSKRSPRRIGSPKTARRLFDQEPSPILKQTQSSRSKIKVKSPSSSLVSNLTSPYSPTRTRKSSSSTSSPARVKSSPTKSSATVNTPPRGSSPRRTFNPKSDVSPNFKGIIDRRSETTTRFNVSLDETPTKDVGSAPRRKWNIDSKATMLDQVNSGDVFSRAEWEEPNILSPIRKRQSRPNRSVDSSSTLEERMRTLATVEKQFDRLTKEKVEIESALNRLPTRLSRQARDNERQLEARYDEVVKELGSVRMLLRKYNLLKSST